MLTDWLPFAYFLLFLIVAVFWRAYQVWKQTSVNALTSYHTEGVYGLSSILFRLVFVGIGIVTIANVIPSAATFLTPLDWLEHEILRWLGWVILLTSLFIVIVAQINMGSAWRIGVDTSQKTTLITNGVFQYSRNPIFLAIRMCFFGLLLVLPTAWSLMLWALGDAMIQVQVRLEEQYLFETFGEQYQRYFESVRRWIGVQSPPNRAST